MKNNKFSFLIVIIFFLVGYFLITQHTRDIPLQNLEDRGVSSVKLAGQTIKIDLAKSPEERDLGLSGRESLAEDEGLLFIFDKPGRYSFWMKDMNFSIDIIWISEEGKVIFIKENATPESYPRAFVPDKNARYVLEVVAGFSKTNGLQVGDKVEINY